MPICCVNIQVKLAIIAIVVVIPLTSIVVYGTDSNQQIIEPNDSKLKIISSFYPLHEFSTNVGQEKVNAVLLVPVGVEPHDWEPTIKDVQRMQTSDLIVINGIGFENWVDDLDENNFQGTIIDTSNGILVKQLSQEKYEKDHNKDYNLEYQRDEHEDEHNHGTGDPHIWLNPVYAKTQVQNIANAFSNSDPENQEYYQDNAAKYIKQLDLLDLKIKTELSSCKHDFYCIS